MRRHPATASHRPPGRLAPPPGHTCRCGHPTLECEILTTPPLSIWTTASRVLPPQRDRFCRVLRLTLGVATVAVHSDLAPAGWLVTTSVTLHLLESEAEPGCLLTDLAWGRVTGGWNGWERTHDHQPEPSVELSHPTSALARSLAYVRAPRPTQSFSGFAVHPIPLLFHLTRPCLCFDHRSFVFVRLPPCHVHRCAPLPPGRPRRGPPPWSDTASGAVRPPRQLRGHGHRGGEWGTIKGG
jgi:hypothetical protein